MANDRRSEQKRRKTDTGESFFEDKIFLPDWFYFVKLIQRNFIKASLFAIFPLLFIVISITNFKYLYTSYETVTYSSVDSLFESDNKEIYYLGYEAKFFQYPRKWEVFI